jgi:hypothetical protein
MSTKPARKSGAWAWAGSMTPILSVGAGCRSHKVENGGVRKANLAQLERGSLLLVKR